MYIMFSLCIPTMDRFDTYLNTSLDKYLNFDLISEIVICDENGNDAVKIHKKYQNHINYNKLHIFVNDNRLGCIRNKMKTCMLSSNKWIALIDSDNFAPLEYFQTALQFITNNNPDYNTILCPEHALPNFHFTKLLNQDITLGNIPDNSRLLLNTGNYIISRELVQKTDISNIELKGTNACDVLCLNLWMIEQNNAVLKVLKDMNYYHAMSKDSITLKEHHTKEYKHMFSTLLQKIKVLNTYPNKSMVS